MSKNISTNNIKTKMEIVARLAQHVSEYPGLRVAQILSNAAILGGWKGNDPFYCPDEIILEGLKLMVKGTEQK